MMSTFLTMTTDLRREKLPVLLVMLLTVLIHFFLWLAWVPHLGPDGSSYLIFYRDLFHNAVPVEFTTLMYRLPAAPILQTWPLMQGVEIYVLSQTMLAMLCAVMVYLIARLWGRLAAGLAVCLYLLNLPVQIQFHQVSVDSIYLTAVLVVCLALRYALQNMTLRTWALLGVAIGCAMLTRPNGLLFMGFLVALLLSNYPWRVKFQYAAAMVMMPVLIVAPWLLYKGLKYDLWSYTRSGGWVWFYVTYSNPATQEEVVLPANGAASQELAAMIRNELLTTPLYQDYGITEAAIYDYRPAGRNFRFYQDIVALVDVEKGYASHSEILQQVSLEAVQAHPATFVQTVIRSLRSGLLSPAPLPSIPQGRSSAAVPPTSERPAPDEGELIPYSLRNMWATRPTSVPFPDEATQATHQASMESLLARLGGKGDQAIGSAIQRVWQRLWVFTPTLFYLLTLLALLVNRGKSLLYLLLINGACVIILFTSLLLAPFIRYRLEVEPVFMISAAVGLASLIRALRHVPRQDYLA